MNRQLKPGRELRQLGEDSDLGARLTSASARQDAHGSLVAGWASFLHRGILWVCLPGERALSLNACELGGVPEV